MTASPEFLARVERAKAALKQDMGALVRHLVPHGRKAGSSWSAYPPHRESDNPNGFAVYLSGPKAGGWIDFVTQDKGDIFQLIGLVHGHSDFVSSLRWAEDRYGLSARLSDEERRRLSARAEVQAARASKAEAEEAARKMRRACHAFSMALPEIEGTPVERYWRGRGIDIRELKHLERRWVRFHPNAPYPFVEGYPLYPAQYWAFVDGAGVMRALHATYLAPGGAGKADVPKAKVMFGPMKGSMLRVAMGCTGLDPEAAVAAGAARPLWITEGIEDALSVAILNPEARVWAAGSLSNYLEIPDHACASGFILVRDNDWGKAQPAQVFERALRRLKGFGKPVDVMRSPAGKDFNDYLKEVA